MPHVAATCQEDHVRKGGPWTSSEGTAKRRERIPSFRFAHNYPKAITTWQLPNGYMRWTRSCQPHPRTPSEKPPVTAERSHTRIQQKRGMGLEWGNHRLNSLFRSKEAATPLPRAVLLPPPNIFRGWASFLRLKTPKPDYTGQRQGGEKKK